MQKGQGLIFVIVGILVAAIITGGAYYLGRSISPQPSATPTVISPASTQRGEQTPQPTPAPSSSPDKTAGWKTFGGKYFTFKYPSTWPTAYSTTGQSDIDGYSKVLEITNSRISPNAVFEVTYRNYSYEENVQQRADRKSQKLSLDGREATKFELQGSGQVLPKGYSIISAVVRGSDNTSYTITFNGDRKDITDSLIDQILSTFKFL